MASHVHGIGRISAALVAAPAAALAASFALAAILPRAGDLHYLAFAILVFPAMAAAPCLALLARSGARAWIGSAAVSALSLAILAVTT